MDALASSFNKVLPRWLEKTQMPWVQWGYAFWQILRCNPLILFLLSFLPFYLRQRYRKKRVIVLGSSKDYDMNRAELTDFFEKGYQVNNLEVVGPVRYWYCVKHRGYYYLTHQNTLMELAKLTLEFGADVIFVERPLTITGSLSVARELSQTEGYEKVLSKAFHCGRGSDYVVPTWFNYIDVSSKFWGVLSTVPILLQARKYNRFSNLLSLVIILLDLNRGWIYRLYDRLFDQFVKAVQLHVFKKNTALYNFFSAFSVRWRYTDTREKYAYIAKPGSEVSLGFYTKLEDPRDVEIRSWEEHVGDPNDQEIYFRIDKERAVCYLKRGPGPFPKARLNREEEKINNVKIIELHDQIQLS